MLYILYYTINNKGACNMYKYQLVIRYNNYSIYYNNKNSKYFRVDHISIN